jgi:general secretion pathway protein G
MISRLRERISSVAKREEGFTLIELMIVIAVLGILAGIAIPRFSGVQEKAEDTNITSMAGTLRNAMEMYYASNGNYPASGDLDSTDYDGLINTDSMLNEYVDLPAKDDLPISSSSYVESGSAYVLKIVSSASEETYLIGDKGTKKTSTADNDVTSDTDLTP